MFQLPLYRTYRKDVSRLPNVVAMCNLLSTAYFLARIYRNARSSRRVRRLIDVRFIIKVFDISSPPVTMKRRNINRDNWRLRKLGQRKTCTNLLRIFYV